MWFQNPNWTNRCLAIAIQKQKQKITKIKGTNKQHNTTTSRTNEENGKLGHYSWY